MQRLDQTAEDFLTKSHFCERWSPNFNRDKNWHIKYQDQFKDINVEYVGFI